MANIAAPPDDNELRRDAQRLCFAVRSYDRPNVDSVLESAHARGLCVMLAAMTPLGRSPGDLLAWTAGLPSPLMPPGDDLTALAARGITLAAAVRDWDRTRIAAAIGDARPEALAVVLAAMVPDDVPVDELLAWTRNPGADAPVAPLATPGFAHENGGAPSAPRRAAA